MIGGMIGSYQIERVLGRGGFGVVYVGVDTRLGRRAAIKQLLPEMSTNREVVERFFNEAKAAASINHPGIVEIYDVGYHEGSVYFAMKLLDGQTLHARLQAGRLAIPLAATIARQVSGALVAAHARGIIHRDLKPDNVMLVRDDEVSIGERAVLLDFGIAKLTSAQNKLHTQSGMMMGTPKYMSPEQCRGAGEVDHRTDIYALGCILFEMLAGRVPFLAEGAGEIMGMHQFVEPPPLRAFRPDAPPELEALVGRLLAKRLDQRMQLMGELQTALQPFTAGASPAIAPPAHPVFPAPSPTNLVAGLAPTVPPTAIARPRSPTPGPLPPDAPTHAVPDPRASTPDAMTRAVPEPTPQAMPVEDRSRVLSSPVRIPEPLLRPVAKRSKLPLVIALLVVVAGGVAAVMFVMRKSKPAVDPDPVADAAVVVKPTRVNDPRRDELIGQCEQAAADRKWPELGSCASQLDAIDPAAARQYVRLASQHGATVTLTPRPSKDPPPDAPEADCADADALVTKGETALSRSEFRAAFDALDAAYKCKPAVLESYFIASCRSRNFDRAKELFPKLPAARRDELALLCKKDGLDPRKSE